MKLVLITALGVGGATIIGSVIGFAFKKLTHKFTDIVLSFAAGVMLAAAVFGLILPSIEYGGKYGLIITVAGIFAGAIALNLIDKLVPHIHKLAGIEQEAHSTNNQKLSKVLPFALAFAGGTMLYVISDEMIPETHAHGSERGATYALLVGFCLMLVSDILLG